MIVPSRPVTPGLAVGFPASGGQDCAQTPVQAERAAVSGANQYRVRPLRLVSTVAPLIVVVFRTVAVAGAAGGPAPGGAPAPPTATPSSTRATADIMPMATAATWVPRSAQVAAGPVS